MRETFRDNLSPHGRGEGAKNSVKMRRRPGKMPDLLLQIVTNVLGFAEIDNFLGNILRAVGDAFQTF